MPQHRLVVAALLLLVGRCAVAETAGDDPVAYLRLRIPAHTAPITAVAFGSESRELYSAGLDKVVHAWRRGEAGGWRHRGAARWEVGYGKNGQIRALGVNPESGLLAIGGYGNRGMHGELVLFDPGRLDKFHAAYFPTDHRAGAEAPLQHEQVVVSAAFSPGGEWLASADVDGRVLLWAAKPQAAGKQKPPVRQLARPDRGEWEGQVAPVGVRPLCWTGPHAVLYPKFSGVRQQAGYQYAVWRIERTRLDPQDPAKAPQVDLLPGEFYVQLTALAASADGKRLVAAGLGQTKVYEFAAGNEQQLPQQRTIETRITPDRYVHSLALSPDGQRLAIGRVATGPDQAGATAGKIELWNLSNIAQPARVWEEKTPSVVSACAIGPAGAHLAFAAGNDLHTVALRNGLPIAETRQTLPGGPQTRQVGFLDPSSGNGASPYRLYVHTTAARRIFDPQAEDMMKGLPAGRATPQLVTQSQDRRAGWAIARDDAGVTLTTPTGQRVAIPLDPQQHGRVTTHCWVDDAQGQPTTIALGTEKSDIVLLYDLPTQERPQPRLVRYFLGHEGEVTSLGVSADQKYLVSGSTDGTAAVWQIDIDRQAPALMTSWGVELAPHAAGAEITAFDEQGPFYNRGLQVGDVLTRAIWNEGRKRFSASGLAAIRDRLTSAVPAKDPPQIAFDVTRKSDGARITVQAAPIWNQLMSLYSRDWNWIAWTPSGYYESSVQGDRIIGWQFTRTAGEAPLFATADQFYDKMRRPDLIKNLLGAGGLAEAAIDAGDVELEKVAPASLPVVKVTSPPPGLLETREREFELVAEVSVSPGDRIEKVALLRDGVLADRKIIAGDQRSITTRWRVPLEDRDLHQYAVAAWGTSGDSQSAEEIVARWVGRGRRNPRTLWLLAVGVAEYPSSVAPEPLEFATTDAEQVAHVFGARHAYDEARVTLLTTPEETTGQRIRAELQELIKKPDGNDTAVFYFAGHSSEPAAESPTGAAGDEISLLPIDGPDPELTPRGLLSAFCRREALRKVVIIDSCRSGAFQRAVSELARSCDQESCGTSFFASSQANELSRESREHRAGWLTHFVVEGLQGRAATIGQFVNDMQLGAFLYPAVTEATEFQQEPVIAIPEKRDAPLPLTIREAD